MNVVKDMDAFGLLVKILGLKLTSATWPLLGEIPPLDVAKDRPKTSVVTMAYADQRQQYLYKNLRRYHSDICLFFLHLIFHSCE